jgi:calreticulin
MNAKVFVFLALVALVSCEVYFSEKFDENWESRWVKSTNKGSDAGKWKLSHGTYFADEKEDLGIQTSEDYRFYQISAGFKEFSNKDDVLVLQYSIKNDQKLDCGGGYVKLLPAGLDQTNFNGDSEYNIMFGPDICGGTKRVHVILTYKGKNYLINKQISPETDSLTHVYTLIVRPDQTYSVLIDNVEKQSGKLVEDWDFLPPKTIKDPNLSKPSDWVDEATIPDPDAVKPEGWDDVPEYIADPDASMPEDWDTDLDGDWEAPIIPNPDFQGEWTAPRIPNPAYKGQWVHPLIDNPDYYEDNEIYSFKSHAFLGIEIWQVKSGSIFDNFLVTNDVVLASKEAQAIVNRRDVEKVASEEADRIRREKEEEERKRLEDELEEEEEEDAHAGHSHDEL